MRILIADDNALLRRAIGNLLSREPDCSVCGEAADGAETLKSARELQPDLLLLDISLPDANGFEISRQLRAELPALRILIISQQDATLLLPSALEAGADGCVDKAQIASDLLPAMKKLQNEKASGQAGN